MIPPTLVYLIVGLWALVVTIVILVRRRKPRVKKGKVRKPKKLLSGRDFVRGVRSGRIKNPLRDEKSLGKLMRAMADEFVLPEETRELRRSQKVIWFEPEEEHES